MCLGGVLPELLARDAPVAANDAVEDRALTSPYRGVRRRAVEALCARPTAAVDGQRLLEASDPRLRRAAVEVLGRIEAEPDGDQVCARLLIEDSAEVRWGLARLLALRSAVDLDALHQAALSRPDDVGLLRLLDRVIASRSRRILEARMSDGRVPGFYDGQFTELWTLAPDMYSRLLGQSRTEGLHYVLRAMALMAMHEVRRDSMEEDLGEILLDEDDEFDTMARAFFNPRPRVFEIGSHRRADLSRYARFALAKAGDPDAVLRMIARMDEELGREENRSAMTRALRNEDEDWRTLEELRREWLLGLLFETGYYFQQFDNYKMASARYLRLVQNYPDSSACQNAYYNLACIASIEGRHSSALRALRRAIERGFTDYEWLLEDRDLKPLWGSPEFDQLVELARTGRVREGGAEWMAKIRPALPVGTDFQDLGVDSKRALLRKLGDVWTKAEREELLGTLPQEEVEPIRALWAELGIQDPRPE